MANGWGGARPGAGRKPGSTAIARRDSAPAKQPARADGWANVFTGKGIATRDPRLASVFTPAAPLDQGQLEDQYRHGGILGRIVDELPNLVTRDPWSIAGDTDGEIWRYLSARDAQKALRKALRWSRLYGGAIVVLGVNDGGGLESELRTDAVRSLDFLRVYDRHQVVLHTADYEKDIRKPRYGQRNYYTVQPKSTGINAQSFRVHWSRVLEFDGRDVPERVRVQNQGWGDSVLQRVAEEVRRLIEGLDDGEIVLRDFVQGVLQIKNLTSLMSTPEGEKLVQGRLNILDLSRHILNTMVIDEGETYTKQISSVSGIGDLLDRFMAVVAAAAEMPQAVLFGRAPAGLNATGDSDMRTWYDSAAAFQRENLAPAVEKLAEIAVKATKDGPKVKGLPQPLQVRFAPLWQPTMKEQADTRHVIAQADALYLDRNVLAPAEVASARFGGDEFSIGMKLLVDRADPDDPSEDPDPEDPPPEGEDDDEKGDKP